MRLITALLLTVSLSLPAIVNAGSFKNEPNGFRGVKWSDKFSKHKSKFVLLESKNNASFYKRNNEDMAMGRAKFSLIAYRFYKGRFSGILAFTQNGDSHKRALIKALKNKYGAARKPFPDQERYLWQGDKTRIYLECRATRQNCTLLMMSMKMSAREKADR